MTTLPQTQKLVGTLELASKYRYGLTSRGAPLYLFRPYDEDRPEYIVGCSERDTSRNQLAVVEVPVAAAASTGTQKLRGNLIRLLGPVGDPEAERAALLQHYCPTFLLKSIVIPEPDTSEDAGRLEISATTGWTVLHVDPPGCRDIDDAIAWHPTERRWAIVIADVAAAVPPDHPVDIRARTIGATFYDLEGRVVCPMLPPAISDDTASLLPGQRRRGVALLFPADSAVTADPVWSLCWVTVGHSYTYETFATSPHAWMAKGQDPPPWSGVAMEPHDWIADLMIRYNAAAAALLQSHGVGLLRVQPPADAASAAVADTWPPELRHLLNERATYQAPDPTRAAEQGHAGLGLPAYAHTSSPLRRYADLINQRAVKAILRSGAVIGGEVTDLAIHLNDRTTANRRWTRDLTFLTHVTPGRVHLLDVVPVSPTHVWVPLWGRLLRLRHEPTESPTRIAIFCDPTKRNWHKRVLTAPASPAPTSE